MPWTTIKTCSWKTLHRVIPLDKDFSLSTWPSLSLQPCVLSADSINTKASLESIRELVTATNIYMTSRKKTECNTMLLTNVATYIARILKVRWCLGHFVGLTCLNRFGKVILDWYLCVCMDTDTNVLKCIFVQSDPLLTYSEWNIFKPGHK